MCFHNIHITSGAGGIRTHNTFSASPGYEPGMLPLHYRACDRAGIQTQDPQLRRLLLYSTELLDQLIF